jgi:catechol 2,3-dioxygenase-like lactoylglutathione lyase family enzyme
MASVERLSAVTFAVADMARAVAFYETLGFEALYGGDDAPFTSFRLDDGGFVNLQLVDGGPPPAARGWGRAVFWVDDVDTMHERVLAAGLSPSMAPSDAPWGERYFHITDPDGHELSFARPL